MMQRKLASFEVDEIATVLNAMDKAAELIGCNDARQYFPDTVDMLTRMKIHQTNDGEPYVEPIPEVVIDDKRAAVSPRRWVMAKDHAAAAWLGPFRLGCVDTLSTGTMFRVVDGSYWRFCRPATAAEIATVEPVLGVSMMSAEPNQPIMCKDKDA